MQHKYVEAYNEDDDAWSNPIYTYQKKKATKSDN